jgi:dihydroorotase
MNSATKDILNVASKMMAIGLTLQEAVADMTFHPARQLKKDGLGHLSVGAIADLAVLGIRKGRFGFTDMVNTRVNGTAKLVAELTIKDGRIVYDLNGLEALPWDSPQGDTRLDSRWTSFARPAASPCGSASTHLAPWNELVKPAGAAVIGAFLVMKGQFVLVEGAEKRFP